MNKKLLDEYKEKLKEIVKHLDDQTTFIRYATKYPDEIVWLTRHDLLMDVCGDKKDRSYTLAEAVAKVVNFQSKVEWIKSDSSSYRWARSRNLIDFFASHMENPKPKWDKESVRQEALKYQTKHNFFLGSGGAYQWARQNNILNEVCKHMIKKRRSRLPEVELPSDSSDIEENLDLGVDGEDFHSAAQIALDEILREQESSELGHAEQNRIRKARSHASKDKQKH